MGPRRRNIWVRGTRGLFQSAGGLKKKCRTFALKSQTAPPPPTATTCQLAIPWKTSVTQLLLGLGLTSREIWISWLQAKWKICQEFLFGLAAMAATDHKLIQAPCQSWTWKARSPPAVLLDVLGMGAPGRLMYRCARLPAPSDSAELASQHTLYRAVQRCWLPILPWIWQWLPFQSICPQHRQGRPGDWLIPRATSKVFRAKSGQPWLSQLRERDVLHRQSCPFQIQSLRKSVRFF